MHCVGSNKRCGVVNFEEKLYSHQILTHPVVGLFVNWAKLIMVPFFKSCFILLLLFSIFYYEEWVASFEVLKTCIESWKENNSLLLHCLPGYIVARKRVTCKYFIVSTYEINTDFFFRPFQNCVSLRREHLFTPFFSCVGDDWSFLLVLRGSNRMRLGSSIRLQLWV